MKQFFGKYRGKVVSNADPKKLGRIQVSVPAVLGQGSMSWAEPCVPYAGPGVGLFAIPPEKANVWVEFEGGDPDYPIWSGCFWEANGKPPPPAVAEVKVFKTKGITLTLDDRSDGGFTLEVDPSKLGDGAAGGGQALSIKVTPSGIELSGDGQGNVNLAITSSGVELDGGDKGKVALSPMRVLINDGALEVT